MSISIIIPTLNDNPALQRLLEQIRAWSNQPKEIIVVDAMTDPECEKLCAKSSVIYLSFKKNRGAQQKFGADYASGDVLWFLHADAKPHEDALDYIESAVYVVPNYGIDESTVGGFFRFSFDAETLTFTQKILTLFTNWRSRHFTAYGDQGIFVIRKFYEHMEGHSDQALFEEVRLIKAMRKSGPLAISTLPIKVSTRRWDKDGYWKRTLHNRFLALAYMFGVSAEKLSDWYTSKQK